MTKDGARLVLASASPRRLELLQQIGLTPDAVAAAEIEELPKAGEKPRAFAERMAGAKAARIASRHGDAFVLAADTVVACGRRILGKAKDEDEAERFLTLLSGRRNQVITAICVIAPSAQPQSLSVVTSVSFKRLSAAERRWYLASGEWQGKAGAYAIQGRASCFIKSLNGSHSNVIGLPLFETSALLVGLGFPLFSSLPASNKDGPEP